MNKHDWDIVEGDEIELDLRRANLHPRGQRRVYARQAPEIVEDNDPTVKEGILHASLVSFFMGVFLLALKLMLSTLLP